MVSIQINDIPDEDLRVLTKSFSYLASSGCKNELNVEEWYIKPSLSKNQLWTRQFEDCLSTQLGRGTEEYCSQLSDACSSFVLKPENIPIHIQPDKFSLFKNKEFLGVFENSDESDDNSEDCDAGASDDDDDDNALVRCSRCGAKATWKLKQTRSADEPMTQMCTCTGCGKEWRQ